MNFNEAAVLARSLVTDGEPVYFVTDGLAYERLAYAFVMGMSRSEGRTVLAVSVVDVSYGKPVRADVSVNLDITGLRLVSLSDLVGEPIVPSPAPVSNVVYLCDRRARR